MERQLDSLIADGGRLSGDEVRRAVLVRVVLAQMAERVELVEFLLEREVEHGEQRGEGEATELGCDGGNKQRRVQSWATRRRMSSAKDCRARLHASECETVLSELGPTLA